MRPWQRWAAATGIGFVLAASVGFLIRPRPPMADETRAEILDFFMANEAQIRWQSFFFGVAGMFLLWFGGTLAAALRRVEEDSAGLLPGIVVASAATGAALFWLGVTSWAAVALGIGEVSDATAYGLYHLGSVAFVITDFPAAVFVWSASARRGRLAGRRGGRRPGAQRCRTAPPRRGDVRTRRRRRDRSVPSLRRLGARR